MDKTAIMINAKSEFQFHKAVREQIRLLIGLSGGTGSGKTYSAMRLAKGLSGDKRFAVIDTENGRASGIESSGSCAG